MNISNYSGRTVKIRMIFFTLLCLSIFGLAGCGGGGGGGPANSGSEVTVDNTNKNIATGVFLDSKVEGITYISGSISGVTDANGTFRYETGGTVRFMIGDLLIGEAQGKELITPVDFVRGGSVSQPTVLNIVRFLLTIDNDGNPDNGIQISKTMHNLASKNSISFAQSAADFAANGNVQTIISEITAATTAGARTLVADSAAQNHLSGTIWKYYAGRYTGTFSGEDSGAFDVTIMANGMIAGTGSSKSEGGFVVTGQLATDGTLSFATGSTSTSAAFKGKITTGATLSGTWKNSGETGKFSGQRVTSKTASNTTTGNTEASNTEGNASKKPYGSFTLSGADLTGTYIPTGGPLPSAYDPNVVLMEMWRANSGDSGVWNIDVTMYNQPGFTSFMIVFSKGLSIYYSCKAGGFGSYGDCSGVSNDVSTRTVTFTKVKLQGPGFGDVIVLNGTLKY